MTTIRLDTRTFQLRFPAIVLGRLGTSLVVQVTEHIELRVERRAPRRLATRARRAQHVHHRAELDDHRTRGLAQRLGTL